MTVMCPWVICRKIWLRCKCPEATISGLRFFMMLIQSHPVVKDHKYPGFPLRAPLTYSGVFTSSGWPWWSLQPPSGSAPMSWQCLEPCGWNSIRREGGKDETKLVTYHGDIRNPSYLHTEIKVNQEMDGVFQVTSISDPGFILFTKCLAGFLFLFTCCAWLIRNRSGRAIILS